MSNKSSDLLKSVEEGLNQLTVTSSLPSSHPLYNRMLSQVPIACLKIPNKFYLAADRIYCLRTTLKVRKPSLIELVNTLVEEGSDKISYNASNIEERLQLQSRR